MALRRYGPVVIDHEVATMLQAQVDPDSESYRELARRVAGCNTVEERSTLLIADLDSLLKEDDHA